MQQALKLKEQEQFEENSEKNIQTVIETETDLTPQEVNVELAERTLTTTKTEKIVDGEEKTVIDMDESKDVQQISYPRPDNIYSEETEDLSLQSQEQEETEKREEENFRQRSPSTPKKVFIRVKVPEKIQRNFPADAWKVPETAGEEDLQPSVVEISVEDSEEKSSAFIKEVTENPVPDTSESSEESPQNFRTETETSDIKLQENYTSEERYEEQEEDDFEVTGPVENPEFFEETEEENYDLAETGLEPVEDGNDYGFLQESLEDFEGLESYSFVSEGVLKAEYDSVESEKGVSERVLVSLDSLTETGSLTASDVVEYLGSETAIDATVAEIPYFSENSGKSWEDGWNSFDMVLQMEDMDFQNMEYMISDPGETRETPSKRSIDGEFDSSKVLEFRESEEWSMHTGSYEASDRTKNAWTEKYGEEILELDSMERGLYAAIVEVNEFRGSEIDFTEMGLENGEFLEEVYNSETSYREDFSPGAAGRGRATALS